MVRQPWDPRQWGSQAKPYHRLVWFGHHTWHLYPCLFKMQCDWALDSTMENTLTVPLFWCHSLKFQVGIPSWLALFHMLVFWLPGGRKESLACLSLSWRVGSGFPPRLTQSETPPNGKSIGVLSSNNTNGQCPLYSHRVQVSMWHPAEAWWNWEAVSSL